MSDSSLKIPFPPVMKIIPILILFLSLCCHAFAQRENPNYDPDLAEELGADIYGMKSYILVILKTGSNLTEDRDFIQNSFAGHLQNIHRLVETKELIVAGPMFPNPQNYRGIFILNVDSIEKANELLQTDPAIKEKLLAADLYQWYGSAALSKYLDTADLIWNQKP